MAGLSQECTMNNRDRQLLFDRYVDAIREAFADRDYLAAEQIMKRAFKDAEELGAIDAGLVQCVHDLAEFYQERGIVGRADWLCNQVLDLRARVLGSDHQDADVENESSVRQIFNMLRQQPAETGSDTANH